ncbi:hypothetical protein BH18VER1_BH18VER1_05220 [soil metagenome]
MSNILFVLYHDFTSNSAIHVHSFANQLASFGHGVAVAVPDNKETVENLGARNYAVATFREIDGRWAAFFENGNGPDVVHAWTPRENVRLFCEKLASFCRFALVVHLEDNEELILEINLGKPFGELERASSFRMPPNLSHPTNYRRFLASAAGVTIIMDRLQKFVPESVPHLVLWPGADRELFHPRPKDTAYLESIGVPAESVVLCYTGNAHSANAREVRSLYLAVAMLNREEIPAALIRAGADYCSFLGPDDAWAREHSIEIGYVSHFEVPQLLSLADYLIQPGTDDSFNEFRLPAKLPEFFSMGQPVILPRTNVGRFVQHGEDAWVLDKVDALGIVDTIKKLRDDEPQRRRLAEGALRFAAEHFSWSKNARTLEQFYAAMGGQTPTAPATKSGVRFFDHAAVTAIRSAYPTEPPQSGTTYATVRDYCDSLNRLPQITGFDGDLKNVQRPWAVKTLLRHLPPGARLLEVGGGEPVVSGALSELGYDVTLVDPYDGFGNGPTEFETYVTKFPHVKLVRAYLTSGMSQFEPGSFDAVFSVSVIEHLPADPLASCFRGIAELLRSGGVSLHCFDFILQGTGHDTDLTNATRILGEQARLMNRAPDPAALDEVLAQLCDDVETFYLSPQGHNQWRNQLPYDEFPFRKVVSIQTLATRSS